MNVKKIAVYGGIVILWVGGYWVAYKSGEGIGRLCSKATDKLLAFL